ncbi:hypothetical protein SAMN05421664_2205 [Chryseobacterium soldanellicola]|uniref:Uncharacterized protein n=1 Tax=Chryseobacterium soldanellicola TaxID=311333 RepID=A0A1H1CZ62_9FLAO|nr:hypothetical protein SAMN05421664_2205 [Chryseobacterium soldanellicola]
MKIFPCQGSNPRQGNIFVALFCVRDAAGGDEGAGASEERTSTEAKRTPKQPGPRDLWNGPELANL